MATKNPEKKGKTNEIVEKQIKAGKSDDQKKETSTPKETEIGEEEIMRKLGGVNQSLRELQPIQKEGLKLLYFVGSIMLLIILFLLIDFIVSILRFGCIDQIKLAIQTKESLSLYSDFINIVVNRIDKIFDTFIVKALLPVFTTILGYIFGSNSDKG